MNSVPFESIRPTRWKRHLAYLIIGLLFLLVYVVRECTTQGTELPAVDVIANHIKQNRWWTVLSVWVLSFALVTLLAAFLHETCHYLAIPSCRTNGTFEFHLKSFTPSISCHVPLSKRRYITAALAPLVVITPAAISIYCLNDNIYIRTAALSVALLNIIGSANDVFAARYVYRSKYQNFIEKHRSLDEY